LHRRLGEDSRSGDVVGGVAGSQRRTPEMVMQSFSSENKEEAEVAVADESVGGGMECRRRRPEDRRGTREVEEEEERILE
jgi:hypothetical protein